MKPVSINLETTVEQVEQTTTSVLDLMPQVLVAEVLAQERLEEVNTEVEWVVQVKDSIMVVKIKT